MPIKLHLQSLLSVPYAFESKYFNKDSGVPLLRIRDVGQATTECKFTGQYEEKYLVKRGDFVVGMGR